MRACIISLSCVPHAPHTVCLARPHLSCEYSLSSSACMHCCACVTSTGSTLLTSSGPNASTGCDPLRRHELSKQLAAAARGDWHERCRDASRQPADAIARPAVVVAFGRPCPHLHVVLKSHAEPADAERLQLTTFGGAIATVDLTLWVHADPPSVSDVLVQKVKHRLPLRLVGFKVIIAVGRLEMDGDVANALCQGANPHRH